MKLGILLTTDPTHENTNTVVDLSRTAKTAGMDVSIFLMHNGVHNLTHAPFLELTDAGVEISLCAHNAGQRGVEKMDNVLFGSQYDLAQIVHECDRFLSF